MFAFMETRLSPRLVSAATSANQPTSASTANPPETTKQAVERGGPTGAIGTRLIR